MLSISLITNAQESIWKANYYSKNLFKEINSIGDNSKEKDPEMQKMLEEALKNASEKQYTLSFNKHECIYEENQTLEKPKPKNDAMMVRVSFSGAGKKYLNLKTKTEIIEDEIFETEFLIINPLLQTNWQLIDETKKIGEYTCYKAQVVIPVSEKELQNYKDFLKQNEKKQTLFQIKEPKPKTVIAWYAPEIPVSFGPNNYFGLPGLILEIKEDEMIIMCTKVQFGNTNKGTIKVPQNGKKVTQKEFDEIQKEKFESMQDENGAVIFKTEMHN
jgi:GLPGLI family protein